MSAPCVLVIDDEAPVRRVIRKVLEELGYEVEEVASCREAEHAVSHLAVDAAVLDYQLTDGTAFPFSGDDISRSFLEEVLRTHPFIGLLFDIGGVRKDRPFVVPRIWCDTPTQGGAPRSSIPRALAGAYRHQLFENLAELVARS